ncbi:unnamed protein product [Blepharisma stoltei]|uniref:Uncharacterized protein n=1 Tax=Blepharisma stoltei TaxID=1481888 RepID=A0AAU9JTD5_9CILI|nr:unnamed protein product [Blepharisma stoltei]
MSATVCCVKKECCWILTILSLLLIIGLELASLGVDRWFEQGADPYDWEGGLLSPTSDSNYYSDSMSYSDFWDDCNDGSNRNKQGLSPGECKAMKHLWAGGVIYILFETISLFCIFLTIWFLLRDICKKPRFTWLAVVLIWFGLAWHFWGLVIWSGLAKMFWGYECSRLDWDHHQEPARVCGKEGPSISLACVLWYFVVCIFWSLFYRLYKGDEEKSGKEATDNGYQKAHKASEVQEDKVEEEEEGEHKHRHRHHHRNRETSQE